MKKLSPQDVAKEIRARFPHFQSDRFKDDNPIFGSAKTGLKIDSAADGKDTRTGSDRFHDYCQIGALLTDAPRCKTHLKSLDDALRTALGWSRIKAAPVFSPLSLASAAQALPTAKRIPGFQDAPDAASAHDAFEKWRATNKEFLTKWNGVLQKVLQQKEDRHGFNNATLQKDGEEEKRQLPVAQVVKPGKTPTLTGFVQPSDFGTELLQQMRHWKDPGARYSHGEFTHRLQWWIIMCEKEQSKAVYRIRTDLRKLFAALPKYAYIQEGQTEVKDGQNMFTFLCDCFTNSPPKSDSYRTPDNLHADVMTGGNQLGMVLSVLPAIITSRQNKRLIFGSVGYNPEEYCAWKLSQAESGYAPEQKKIAYKS